jgi:ankyrin repeat protein
MRVINLPIDQDAMMQYVKLISPRGMVMVFAVLAILFAASLAVAEPPSHRRFAIDILNQTSNPVNMKFYELIKKNSYQELQEFLQRGADPNVTDDFRVSPIHYASFFGSLQALNILIEYGADVTASPYGGWSPLHYASSAGHKHIVAALLTAEAPVDQRDDGGETALFYAVESGNLKIVRLLVEFGALINTVNRHSKTPLDFAIQFQHLDIATYLISKGAKSGRETTPQESIQPILKTKLD